MSRLGDVCDFLNGYAFKSEKYVEAGIRIIRIANVQKGVIEDSSPVFYPKTSVEAQKYSLEDGDLLISLTGNVGRVALLTADLLPAALNQRVACLRIKHGIKLDKSYLFNFLNSDFFEQKCIEASNGVAQKNMSTEWLKNYEIPIPSLERQKEIAALLDHVTSLCEAHSNQLRKLDELVKSRFIELFGGCTQTKPLENFADLITKGASPKWQGVEYADSGTLFVTSENVRAGYIDLEKRKYLDNRINEIQPRSVLQENDVLINIVGASIGRAAIFKCNELANINQAVALVRINTNHINLQFLIIYLNSTTAMELYDKMKKGGARDNLSLKNIADLPIPITPIELQNEFAAFVEQTDKLKLAVKQSLDKLETLKKSLMQEYFG